MKEYGRHLQKDNLVPKVRSLLNLKSEMQQVVLQFDWVPKNNSKHKLYQKILNLLINLSNEELLKIILYGHEQLPFDSNAKILTAALEYIQASKRFE